MPIFYWDLTKEQLNISKHGIGFELAETVFEDPDLLLWQDRIVDDEERWQALGAAAGQILLLVAHVVTYGDDDQEFIGIISARRADNDERATYRSFHAEGRGSTFS